MKFQKTFFLVIFLEKADVVSLAFLRKLEYACFYNGLFRFSPTVGADQITSFMKVLKED